MVSTPVVGRTGTVDRAGQSMAPLLTRCELPSRTAPEYSWYVVV